MATPQHFPLLTRQEFNEACKSLIGICGNGFRGKEWNLASADDEIYIKVERQLLVSPANNYADQKIDEEDDEEVILRPSIVACLTHVEYDILLSPSYQVPVLSFCLRDVLSSQTSVTEDVYAWLVPDVYKASMREVGILGAISCAEHPLTSRPAFFIHPCHTADAMREMAKSTPITVDTYLQVWLGIIGGCVGLSVPLPSMN